MKIFGIGTDIVNIKRIEKTIKKNGEKFKNKIFSSKEIAYCDSKKNSISFYAKRFAAKEAFTKALGTGIRKDVSLKNIEVTNNSQGKPLIKLSKNLNIFLKNKLNGAKYDIHLSLSDDKPWAQATVIISYNK
jgi:holo-[acyl-carrier protein] synthase